MARRQATRECIPHAVHELQMSPWVASVGKPEVEQEVEAEVVDCHSQLLLMRHFQWVDWQHLACS